MVVHNDDDKLNGFLGRVYSIILPHFFITLLDSNFMALPDSNWQLLPAFASISAFRKSSKSEYSLMICLKYDCNKRRKMKLCIGSCRFIWELSFHVTFYFKLGNTMSVAWVSIVLKIINIYFKLL